VFVSGYPEEEAVYGVEKMAEGGCEPTNRDLMDCLKAMSVKLSEMDKKLGTIDVLEKKVSDFEKELRKVWVALDDRAKKTEERVRGLEDRVDSVDMETSLLSSRVVALEKQREELRDDLTYIKSQSMRNNLVFTNVAEDNSSGNETYEATEKKLRQHLQDALKISKETAESIRFERVHRTPGQPIVGKVRNIVAKFTYFQDRERVRREWKHLKGTSFHMFEQFPKEVMDKRRGLVKKMKDARDAGKKAWIVYDTLYVDGRPVRD
jgi:predicted  nucleic acid-binding Zn-ribbon protein